MEGVVAGRWKAEGERERVMEGVVVGRSGEMHAHRGVEAAQDHLLAMVGILGLEAPLVEAHAAVAARTMLREVEAHARRHRGKRALPRGLYLHLHLRLRPRLLLDNRLHPGVQRICMINITIHHPIRQHARRSLLDRAEEGGCRAARGREDADLMVPSVERDACYEWFRWVDLFAAGDAEIACACHVWRQGLRVRGGPSTCVAKGGMGRGGRATCHHGDMGR